MKRYAFLAFDQWLRFLDDWELNAFIVNERKQRPKVWKGIGPHSKLCSKTLKNILKTSSVYCGPFSN
jgi:hypothetical protein